MKSVDGIGDAPTRSLEMTVLGWLLIAPVLPLVIAWADGRFGRPVRVCAVWYFVFVAFCLHIRWWAIVGWLVGALIVTFSSEPRDA